MTPTFVTRKTDTAIAAQNTVISKASMKKPNAATEAYGYIIKEPPSRPDLWR